LVLKHETFSNIQTLLLK